MTRPDILDADPRGIPRITTEQAAETGFTEWTDAGERRHPRHRGRRRDKATADVVREEPS